MNAATEDGELKAPSFSCRGGGEVMACDTEDQQRRPTNRSINTPFNKTRKQVGEVPCLNPASTALPGGEEGCRWVVGG